MSSKANRNQNNGTTNSLIYQLELQTEFVRKTTHALQITTSPKYLDHKILFGPISVSLENYVNEEIMYAILLFNFKKFQLREPKARQRFLHHKNS